jgi:hypothetical protein
MYSGRRKFPQTPNVNDSSHLEIHQTTITKRGRKRKKQVGENAKGEKKHSNWKRKKKMVGVYPSCLMKSNLIQFKKSSSFFPICGGEKNGKIQVHCSLSLCIISMRAQVSTTESIHRCCCYGFKQCVKNTSAMRERESTQAAPAFRNEMMRGEEKSEPPTSSSDPQLKFNNDAISH